LNILEEQKPLPRNRMMVVGEGGIKLDAGTIRPSEEISFREKSKKNYWSRVALIKM